jgi:translation initiation factor 2 subunit 2
MDYKKLLKKAIKEMPESVKSKERFEIPKVRGHIEGSKTIISNFHQIAQALGREPEHLLKYVLKELAAPGELKPNRLIITRKVKSSSINEKIQKYANEYVICKECKKADTKLEKKEKTLFLRCLACGAQHPVKSRI